MLILGVFWITLVVAFINLNFFREDEEALQLPHLGLQLLVGCIPLFAAFLIRQVMLWIKLVNFVANNEPNLGTFRKPRNNI